MLQTRNLEARGAVHDLVAAPARWHVLFAGARAGTEAPMKGMLEAVARAAEEDGSSVRTNDAADEEPGDAKPKRWEGKGKEP